MLTGIHFLLTYRCTHRCDHCFLHCGPETAGTFTAAQIREILDDAAKLGTVTRIYFEGGEPFLYYPVLLESVRACRERGLEVGVVTNAYWAESVEDAEIWLRPFAELGLTDLTVSDDPLHHGDLEETPAHRAIQAAERLGIPVDSIRIDVPDGVVFRGRAADELTDGLPRLPASGLSECPDDGLADPGRVHVDALGNVHICQGILMGNLWLSPLSEMVRSYDPKKHPIVGPLLRGGPIELAGAHGVLPDSGYVSACHLCYRAREELLSRFPGELGPPQVYDA